MTGVIADIRLHRTPPVEFSEGYSTSDTVRVGRIKTTNPTIRDVTQDGHSVERHYLRVVPPERPAVSGDAAPSGRFTFGEKDRTLV